MSRPLAEIGTQETPQEESAVDRIVNRIDQLRNDVGQQAYRVRNVAGALYGNRPEQHPAEQDTATVKPFNLERSLSLLEEEVAKLGNTILFLEEGN